MRLDNKIALVTGGAVGIGAGIAQRFSEAGAVVVILDVDTNAALRMEQELRHTGRARAIQGDVANEDQVKSAVEQTVAEFGALDILINNAGIDVESPLVEMSSSVWDRTLNVNLKGAFLCSKYAIPHMRERGGVIVNISSVRAFVSYEGNAAYDASKAGMIALTRALALEHGRDGIRVNAVCPGYISSPMTDKWLAAQPDPATELKRVLSIHPLGRTGTARDVAEAALFLASAAAAFISGTYLVVDGAMTAAGH